MLAISFPGSDKNSDVGKRNIANTSIVMLIDPFLPIFQNQAQLDTVYKKVTERLGNNVTYLILDTESVISRYIAFLSQLDNNITRDALEKVVRLKMTKISEQCLASLPNTLTFSRIKDEIAYLNYRNLLATEYATCENFKSLIDDSEFGNDEELDKCALALYLQNQFQSHVLIDSQELSKAMIYVCEKHANTTENMAFAFLITMPPSKDMVDKYLSDSIEELKQLERDKQSSAQPVMTDVTQPISRVLRQLSQNPSPNKPEGLIKYCQRLLSHKYPASTRSPLTIGQNDNCLLFININNQKSTGKALSQTFDALKNEFKTVTVVIGDSLQRHNIIADKLAQPNANKMSTNSLIRTAIQEATRQGITWRNQNKQLLEDMQRAGVKIYSWNTIPNNQIFDKNGKYTKKFQGYINKITDASNNDEGFKTCFEKTSRQYLNNQRLQQSASNMQHCIAYITEQCAAMLMLADSLPHSFYAYNGTINDALRWVHSSLINPQLSSDERKLSPLNITHDPSKHQLMLTSTYANTTRIVHINEEHQDQLAVPLTELVNFIDTFELFISQIILSCNAATMPKILLAAYSLLKEMTQSIEIIEPSSEPRKQMKH